MTPVRRKRQQAAFARRAAVAAGRAIHSLRNRTLLDLADDLADFAALLQQLAAVARWVDQRKVPLLAPQMLSLQISQIHPQVGALIESAHWALQGYSNPAAMLRVAPDEEADEAAHGSQGE